MDGRIRRSGLIDRNVHTRDCWLCIITTEGEKTEREYFESLQRHRVISPSRVKLWVLATPPDGNRKEGPDPEHVLARLSEVQQQYKLSDGDQLWLVLDVDHRSTGPHKQRLLEVLQEASQKGIRLAVSNPCFEIWLLLHFQTEQEVQGLTAAGRGAPSECKAALGAIRAEEQQRYTDALYSREAFERATTRAKTLDAECAALWPTTAGTHVYKLAMALPRP